MYVHKYERKIKKPDYNKFSGIRDFMVFEVIVILLLLFINHSHSLVGMQIDWV